MEVNMGYVVDGPVGKSAAKAVVSESKEKSDGFKKGGRAKKAAGGCGVMSSAAKGKRPARASGGGVFSSAAQGTPRGKASHY